MGRIKRRMENARGFPRNPWDFRSSKRRSSVSYAVTARDEKARHTGHVACFFFFFFTLCVYTLFMSAFLLDLQLDGILSMQCTCDLALHNRIFFHKSKSRSRPWPNRNSEHSDGVSVLRKEPWCTPASRLRGHVQGRWVARRPAPGTCSGPLGCTPAGSGDMFRAAGLHAGRLRGHVHGRWVARRPAPGTCSGPLGYVRNLPVAGLFAGAPCPFRLCRNNGTAKCHHVCLPAAQCVTRQGANAWCVCVCERERA